MKTLYCDHRHAPERVLGSYTTYTRMYDSTTDSSTHLLDSSCSMKTLKRQILDIHYETVFA